MRRPDPVLAWAGALAVGCHLGRSSSASSVAVVAVLAATAVGAVALVRHAPSRGLVALAAVTLTGVAGAAVRTALLDSGTLVERARSGGIFEVSAMVAAEPRVAEHGWWTIVRVDGVDGGRVWQRALVEGGEQPPALGTRWVGRATARPLGNEGFEGYAKSLHAAVELDPRGWQRRGPPGVLMRTTESVRSRVRETFARSLPPARAGLAVGLVTGDTRQLPPEDEEAMRATGLTHLVAVSGSNVAVVAGGAAILCSLAGLGAAARRWMLAVVVIWFAVLTRFEPSVVRAVLMALLLLVAQGRGVIVEPLRSLAATVVVLLLLDPLLVGSLGLILSAVATGGVLVLAPYVRRRLGLLPDRVADLLAVTLGAQLAVAPVLLASQGEVPLSSVPANLVAVPAAAVASIVAGTAAVVAQVSPTLGGGLVHLSEPALATILWVAEHGRGRFGVVTPVQPALFLAVVAAALWLLSRPRSGMARSAAASAMFGLVVASFPWIGARAPVRVLTVTAIDVGQGDAILVESPRATVLVDAGPDERAATWLRRHGKRRIDLLVISHPHADHVGGLPDVFAGSRVASLWHRPVPLDAPALDAALDLARRAGTAVHEPSTGQHARLGDLDIEVLSPPVGRPFRWSDSEPNDSSLVLRVRWGSRAVLLTGDAEVAAQQQILARGLDVRAAVLKVPHHGGATSDARFLEAVGARIALISVGDDNRYGHPHPDVVALLERAGAVVRRTDRSGSIRIEVPAPDGDARVGTARHHPPVASWHAPRLPRHRTRRAAGPACAPDAHRRAARRGPGRRRRDRRHPRGRSPPRAAYGVALRRAEGGGPAGRGAAVR